ncbi:ribonuclease P subunit p20 family protein [Aspergillus lucknowensis]|uniref:Rpp20 subunit of nuclear RNase MRP and P-domain-containing protein n=1 Tax=Aspergillus lucknowensis TaxID=176173 RepID=A0ABR4LVK8_9EURO
MPDSSIPPNQTSNLQFERKNHDMVKLPKHAVVHKRPIPHPPTASPYAGASTPKTIYISSSTPYMSAVKRVQKLLRLAEKRATAAVDASVNKTSNKRGNRNHGGRGGQQQEKMLAALARGEGQESLAREKVFIKATGRAIQTALKVGGWFEKGGREGEYTVRASTGSVLVVDDVEEGEVSKESAKTGIEIENGGGLPAEVESVNIRGNGKEEGTGGDETVLTVTTTTTGQGDTMILSGKAEDPTPLTEAPPKPLSKSALRKRKRAASLATRFAETELPETRTRWVNSVEIAISLK